MASHESREAQGNEGKEAGRRVWTAAHGEKLRELRVERGLRQQELADAIDQPRTVLSNWENATRVPAAGMRRALAAALQVEVSALENPEGPDKLMPDRWSVLRAQMDGFIDDGDRSRVERFIRQSDIFAQLADNEPGTVRWHRLRATANAYQKELTAVTSHGVGVAAAARTIGQQLADLIRSHLGVLTSPLAALTAVAEHSGVQIFTSYLRPGPRGRIRAFGAEHQALGVTTLINAAMDKRHRLHAFAELVGRLLLQPEGASAVLAQSAGTERTRRSPHETASQAFAAQLILPVAAVRQEVDLTDTMTALESSPSDRSATVQARAIALANLLKTYRVTVPVAMTQLDVALRTSEDERRQLLSGPASTVWRTLATTKHAEPGITPTLSDLPTRFLTLLIGEVTAGRSSLQGAAELAGLDVDELRPMMARPRIESDALDDGWLDESGVAVA